MDNRLDRMTKLVFLIRSLNRGGAERQLLTLVKALDQEQFEITVMTFYSGSPLEKELDGSRVTLVTLDKKSRWDLLGFMGRLITELRRIKPDILHGYLGTANILSVLVKPLLPNTKIIWGIRSSYRDFSCYDWVVRLNYRLELLASFVPDLIIFNSYVGKKRYIEQGFFCKNTVVISNGIDTERFKPNPEAKKKIREEFGISQDTILIGLVARLDPVKDHPTFLKAAALLLKKRQDVQFICVGDGVSDYTSDLQQLADDLGISEKVIWTGARDDLPEIYNALDIASSSSFVEGFPNVVGEAMACGISCVVTDVGDSAWIVADTGIVVQPKNPDALAAGWQLCLETDRTAMNSRTRIMKSFSIQSLVNNTEAFLLALIR